MTAIPAPITLRPGWWRTAWAAVWGCLVAGIGMTLLRGWVSGAVEWPDPANRAPGVGWPWRLEGPWSLAADVGPALVFGFLFAWSAMSMVSGPDGIAARRVPTMLAAAALALLTWRDAYVSLNPFALAPLILILRHESTRPRRPVRRIPVTVGLTAVTAVALAAATASYGRVNALSAEGGMVGTSNRGHEYLEIPLRSLGNDILNLRSVSVPGRPDVVIRAWDWIGHGVHPVDGLSVFPGETGRLALRMPQTCTGPIRIDRLEIRMDVGDRPHRQLVRLGGLRDVPCA